MKANTLALTLAAIGVVGFVSAEANAAGAIPYPMSAQAAAQYGIQDAGLPKRVRAVEQTKATFQQVGYSRRGGGHRGGGHHGGHGYHGRSAYYGGHRAMMYPPVVVAPYGGYYPVYRQPYYVPQYNFHYRGRGVSFGIGF